jgi:hypothetical protein
MPAIRDLRAKRVRSSRTSGPPITFADITYSFVGKSADEIIKDLEANTPQGDIGAGAYEIAAAALQAAVARENRRLQIRVTMFSLCLALASLAVAVIALVAR